MQAVCRVMESYQEWVWKFLFCHECSVRLWRVGAETIDIDGCSCDRRIVVAEKTCLVRA